MKLGSWTAAAFSCTWARGGVEERDNNNLSPPSPNSQRWLQPSLSAPWSPRLPVIPRQHGQHETRWHCPREDRELFLSHEKAWTIQVATQIIASQPFEALSSF